MRGLEDVVIRECEACGSDQDCYHSDHAGWFCVDYWDCVARQELRVAQDEADAWYAEQVKLMAERAPA